jgi:oligopeptidase B
MTNAGLVLLRTKRDKSHAGSSGRFNRLEEVAIAYAFALQTTGLA